jgi:spermidine synthase
MHDRIASDPGVCDIERTDDHVRPYVHEGLDSKSMHFSICEIQSRMQILRPDVLELEYTRTMMGLLLFRPQPERIAMIGLGGGSLAKFCHRHLPRASMLVVEINPHVIALRDAFQVPPDHARFHVTQADGARFVRETDARFDVLMVDAFDAQGMPAALGSRRFYDDCLDVLQPGGLLVVNLHAGHPHCQVYVDRIRRSFGENVLRVDDKDGSNAVIFACKGEALRRAVHGALRRPAALTPDAWNQLQGAFARVASALDLAECAQRV